MAITELEVAGYRSIRDLRLPLKRLNVLVGANGCGKSNLYQSVFLLSAAAGGQLAQTLAAEGGMPSALWAGARRKSAKSEPVRMTLRVRLDELQYELSCGITTSPGFAAYQEPSLFTLDPEVKTESVMYIDGRRKVTLMEREASSVWLRDIDGRRIAYPAQLSGGESVLAQLSEPHLFPQLAALRHEISCWRFYHQFRTDPEAPLRQPQVGVRTSVLSHSGHDLAAALQTIREVGDRPGLDRAIVEAFPGAKLIIEAPDGRFSLLLQMPGIFRPLEARELSDGTLRYLCLLGALMSPRPPKVLALNEPETSIHPDLLEPLARLIVRAAEDSQLWITTHSIQLAEHIANLSGTEPVRLEKVDGETRVVEQGLLD